MTDWADLYRAHVAAVTELVTDLPEPVLGQVVPATPAWTVKDVVAHLAGGPADILAGRREDAPGPAWTARHVAARTHLPLADLVTELQANQDAVAASTVDNPRPAVVWDIAVHHADLHEALDRCRMPEPLWAPVVEAVGPMRAPDLVGKVDPYELFRAVFSRRSRSQMRAWDLDEDLDDDAIEAICIFGPRDDDQPVPA